MTWHPKLTLRHGWKSLSLEVNSKISPKESVHVSEGVTVHRLLISWAIDNQCFFKGFPDFILEPVPQGMGAPQSDQGHARNVWESQTQLRFFILWVDFRCGVHSVSTRSTPSIGRARSDRHFSIFKWTNLMPNFEFKKDCVCETALNLALDSIVIVDDDGRPRTQGFRPMVSSAVWGKAPAARKWK